MATITSVQTGNWSDPNTWDAGVPTSADIAIIASGHVVTKDTAMGGSFDCLHLSVFGELALGSNGLYCDLLAYNGASSNGKISGGPGGALKGSRNLESNTYVWDLQGADGNPFTCQSDDADHTWALYGATGDHIFKWVTFTLATTKLRNMTKADVFEDCVFEKTLHYTYINYVRLVRCSSASVSGYACRLSSTEGEVVLMECTLGGSHGYLWPSNRVKVFSFNCKFNSTNYIYQPAQGTLIYNQDVDQVPGDWRIDTKWGMVRKSAAAKKTGDHGIEIDPSSAIKPYPLWVDIPIPVESGDSLSPSIYVKNATADLDLQDAADRMVFELDPGDGWGLNEVIDANTLADIYLNWRQVSFTGGTAGGTGKKGTCILRIRLQRNIASAVVYLADLVY